MPATILVLLLSTLAVRWFELPVETISTKFGGIPQSLPSFTLRSVSWELVKQVFAPTITIALSGAIESLPCARVPDNLIGAAMIRIRISLDTTGLDVLETVHKTLQRCGSRLILCGPNHQPLGIMEQAGFLARPGPENCVHHLPNAVARARELAAPALQA